MNETTVQLTFITLAIITQAIVLFQAACILQIYSDPPPPPWGRVGERAKQLPPKPTFPQPQQTLSLTLFHRRGNRVPQLQQFQTTPNPKSSQHPKKAV